MLNVTGVECLIRSQTRSSKVRCCRLVSTLILIGAMTRGVAKTFAPIARIATKDKREHHADDDSLSSCDPVFKESFVKKNLQDE